MSEAGETWYVLQVPPGSEFRVAHALAPLGLSHHVPCTMQRTRINREGGKSAMKLRKLPLYPKYVFVGVKTDETAPWRKIKEIKPAPVIPVQFDETGPAKLSAREVEHIHNPVVIPLDASPEALTEGVIARIVSGPLEGLQSKIARVRGSYAELEGIGPLGTLRVPVAQLEAA